MNVLYYRAVNPPRLSETFPSPPSILPPGVLDPRLGPSTVGLEFAPGAFPGCPGILLGPGGYLGARQPGVGTNGVQLAYVQPAKCALPVLTAAQLQYMLRPQRYLPPRANRSVRCPVCDITLNSELQARQHYSGKTHLRKVRQLNRESSVATPDDKTSDEWRETSPPPSECDLNSVSPHPAPSGETTSDDAGLRLDEDDVRKVTGRSQEEMIPTGPHSNGTKRPSSADREAEVKRSKLASNDSTDVDTGQTPRVSHLAVGQHEQKDAKANEINTKKDSSSLFQLNAEVAETCMDIGRGVCGNTTQNNHVKSAANDQCPNDSPPSECVDQSFSSPCDSNERTPSVESGEAVEATLISRALSNGDETSTADSCSTGESLLSSSSLNECSTKDLSPHNATSYDTKHFSNIAQTSKSIQTQKMTSSPAARFPVTSLFSKQFCDIGSYCSSGPFFQMPRQQSSIACQFAQRSIMPTSVQSVRPVVSASFACPPQRAGDYASLVYRDFPVLQANDRQIPYAQNFAHGFMYPAAIQQSSADTPATVSRFQIGPYRQNPRLVGSPGGGFGTSVEALAVQTLGGDCGSQGPLLQASYVCQYINPFFAQNGVLQSVAQNGVEIPESQNCIKMSQNGFQMPQNGVQMSQNGVQMSQNGLQILQNGAQLLQNGVHMLQHSSVFNGSTLQAQSFTTGLPQDAGLKKEICSKQPGMHTTQKQQDVTGLRQNSRDYDRGRDDWPKSDKSSASTRNEMDPVSKAVYDNFVGKLTSGSKQSFHRRKNYGSGANSSNSGTGKQYRSQQ